MPRDDRPPYFAFYPADFASDDKVEAMTTEAVGAYMLLLCKAWEQRPVGSLPPDDGVLARWARLTSGRWAAVKPMVVAAFELGQDGRWHQKRLKREYEKLRLYLRQKSEAGRKGAEVKWQSHRHRHSTAIGDATGPPMANDGIPKPKPHSNHQPPPTNGRGTGEVATVWSELAAAGLTEPGISKCCAIEGLSPLAALAVVEEVRKQAKKGRVESVPAVIAHRLLNGYIPPPLIEPLALLQLAKPRILSIAGRDVRGKSLKYNDRGIFWIEGGEQVGVRSSELKPEVIVLARA